MLRQQWYESDTSSRKEIFAKQGHLARKYQIDEKDKYNFEGLLLQLFLIFPQFLKTFFSFRWLD